MTAVLIQMVDAEPSLAMLACKLPARTLLFRNAGTRA
jgi:hypothetical protein